MAALALGVTLVGSAAVGCGSDDPPVLDNSGIIAGKTSVAKFCHHLVDENGAAVELTLQFGKPAITRIFASSNACSPPLGNACTSIPVGVVPVVLLRGAQTLYETRGSVAPDAEYLFAALATTSGGAVIQGSRFKPEFKCADTDPEIELGLADAAARDTSRESGTDAPADADAGDAPDAGVGN